MAKDIQLYDYTGTVKVYPKTHGELVITREGHTVSEALEQLGNEISSVEGNLNSEIDNLKGTVENHEGRIENLEENAIIKDGSITTEKIADRAVTWEKIGFDVIDDVNHLEGRIAELEENAIIKDGSITTEKLGKGSVTTEKISSYSITATKIAKEAIETDKIANFSVTEAKIDTNSITSSKIAESAVTTEKISQNSVNWSKLSPEVRDDYNNLELRVVNLEEEDNGYIVNIIEVTQAEYNALEDHDDSIIYCIIDGTNSLEERIIFLEEKIAELELRLGISI